MTDQPTTLTKDGHRQTGQTEQQPPTTTTYPIKSKRKEEKKNLEKQAPELMEIMCKNNAFIEIKIK